MTPPRIRMIAGPNGSGKSSSIRAFLKPEWLRNYINPDEIQKSVTSTLRFRMEDFGLAAYADEAANYMRCSRFLIANGLQARLRQVRAEAGSIDFGAITDSERMSYVISVLCDFLRTKLLENGQSFTFETVMSYPDKVDLLARAKSLGCRTYLYYVATEDAQVCVDRVRQRVREHGHDVPESKIRERYERSLALLPKAIQASRRAFIFDNSGPEAVHLAEIRDPAPPESGKRVVLMTDTLPSWFRTAAFVK